MGTCPPQPLPPHPASTESPQPGRVGRARDGQQTKLGDRGAQTCLARGHAPLSRLGVESPHQSRPAPFPLLVPHLKFQGSGLSLELLICLAEASVVQLKAKHWPWQIDLIALVRKLTAQGHLRAPRDGLGIHGTKPWLCAAVSPSAKAALLLWEAAPCLHSVGSCRLELLSSLPQRAAGNSPTQQ